MSPMFPVSSQAAPTLYNTTTMNLSSIDDRPTLSAAFFNNTPSSL